MTPIELLHTLLLGLIKYFTRKSVALMDDEKKAVLSARIRGLHKGGLGFASDAKSLVKYTGSLNGKDFRFFVLVAPFVLQDLVPQEWMDAWVAIARFNAVAYRRIIDGSYEEECTKALQHMYLALLKVDVTIFFKRKMHLLSHLAFQCTRNGPGILSASEVYENFVKVLRHLLFLTNRHNPSRDMWRHFTNWQIMRHVCSGGDFPSRKRDQSGRQNLRRLGETRFPYWRSEQA